ncbi:MAG: DnaA N-terminal domain-containing protein, partial [Planctomycetaceae bacterium]
MQPRIPAAIQADSEHSSVREHTGSPGTPGADAPKSSEGESDCGRARILASLRSEIGERNFQHWFADRTSIELSGSCVRVGVAGSFLLTWMQRKFAASLLTAVRRVLADGIVEWSIVVTPGTLPLSEAGNDRTASQPASDTPSGPAEASLSVSPDITGRAQQQ